MRRKRTWKLYTSTLALLLTIHMWSIGALEVIIYLFGWLDQNFKCYTANSFVNNARSKEVNERKTQEQKQADQLKVESLETLERDKTSKSHLN